MTTKPIDPQHEGPQEPKKNESMFEPVTVLLIVGITTLFIVLGLLVQ